MRRLEHRRVAENPSQERTGLLRDRKRNILIVDDDEIILHMLKRFFIREGFQVAVANDGLEAIEKVKADPPAVVLTDLKMPSSSGSEIIKFVRQTKKDMAIVVMTAYPEEWSGNEVQAYFTKPFDIDEMYSTIQRILGG